jgi:hypothetical protein
MEAIWNRQGRVVGWLNGDLIRDLRGGVQAFVYGENVIAFRRGGHRGWLVSGVFRDRAGRAVAFIDGASGITLPSRSSIPSVPSLGSIPSRPSIPSTPNRPSMGGWGGTTFDVFLHGEDKS